MSQSMSPSTSVSASVLASYLASTLSSTSAVSSSVGLGDGTVTGGQTGHDNSGRWFVICVFHRLFVRTFAMQTPIFVYNDFDILRPFDCNRGIVWMESRQKNQ